MTPSRLDWRSIERRLVRLRGLLDDLVALGPSAGLRNVLVHAYLDVDHDRVAAATRAAPELFGEYVRQVARWVAEMPDATRD